MNRYICVHAHCYQPPRENPWLEAVEQQDSAYPHHDWNARVDAECYAQNVAARILGQESKIARIVNNYANISFNMGPTLLSWMQQHDTDTYQALLDADRASREQFSGHGSALAQVYNHMIMPLANGRDKRTQVLWGIRDFEHRFGRKPEGMWLAETAVDLESLELLAEHGVRFTILSPYQARRIRRLNGERGENIEDCAGNKADQAGSKADQAGNKADQAGNKADQAGNKADQALARALGEALALTQTLALADEQDQAEAVELDNDWQVVEGGNIDPSRAYLHKLPSGRSIALFFYDGPVAQAVAFERLLDSGERLAQRLADGFSDDRDWPQLMHIATDGESYGHHHRHGEMALAYALDLISQKGTAELTVYGQFLDLHPPTHEVEIIENTAWSCSHGVGRWQDDCGCNTGRPGWRQTWRRPLREALDWLRDALGPRYERRGGELFHDPWAARDHYIEVVLDRGLENVDAFLRRHRKRALSVEEQRTALMLLEMQRHAMLMYTSCGWFFDELSGIETVQVIQYAGRAVQLARMIFGDRSLEEEFVARLSRAESNLPEWRDGRTIYERAVRPAVVGLGKVAAHYAVSSLFEEYPEQARIYCYDVERVSQEKYTAGRMTLLVGQARVTSSITWNTSPTGYAVIHFGDTHVLGGVREHPASMGWDNVVGALVDAFSRSDLPQVVRVFDEHFPEQSALPTLFRDEQRKVLEQLLDATLKRVDAAYLDIYRENASLIRFLAESNVPVPRTLEAAAAHALTYQLQQEFKERALDRARIEELLAEARDRRVTLDETTLEYTLEHRFSSLVRHFAANALDLDRLLALKGWVDAIQVVPFEVDLWQVQNVYYKLAGSVLVEQRRKAEDGDDEIRTWCEHFLALGVSVRVQVSLQ
jgi:alpha-amylase/alpha-mannosidase (GH57 family)